MLYTVASYRTVLGRSLLHYRATKTGPLPTVSQKDVNISHGSVATCLSNTFNTKLLYQVHAAVWP